MTQRKKSVMGVHAPPPRLTWHAAAIVALCVALPCGIAIQVIWG